MAISLGLYPIFRHTHMRILEYSARSHGFVSDQCFFVCASGATESGVFGSISRPDIGLIPAMVFPPQEPTMLEAQWGLIQIPSGYVKIAIENHHFQWENPLFKW